MQTEKAVSKKEKGAVAAHTAAGWGRSEFSAQDLVIPRIELVQATSDKAKDGSAKFGDLVDSATSEKLGDFKQGIDCVPFHMTKVWVEKEWPHNAKKGNYKRTVQVTPENEDLPFEEVIDAMTTLKRTKVMNFFVMLKDKNVPYVISFKSTSLSAGKQLATQMYVLNASKNLSPAAIHVQIGSKTRSGDNGEYAVLDVKPGAGSLESEVGAAFGWFQRITSKKDVKVTEDSEVVQTESPQPSFEDGEEIQF